MTDMTDTPPISDVGPLDNRDIETLKARIKETLLETPDDLIEVIYDEWRVARDQLMRAHDLLSKALVRLNGDISTYFVSLEDQCMKCGSAVILDSANIGDVVNNLTEFVKEGTENLATKRKRGSKRENGKSLVRISKKQLIGHQTVKFLPGNKKEVSTLVEYLDGGDGHMIPKYKIETLDDVDNIKSGTILEQIYPSPLPPKIQRPSLEKKETND